MIRKAKLADVKAMQVLINQYADKGVMLPRSLNELYENLRDFHVYDEKGLLVGVCALHVSWDRLAEIRSLVVREDRVKQGVGSKLVKQCLDEAAELQVEQVFALTYQDGFFKKLGFYEIDKKQLPHKIWTDCLNCVKFPNCDESAFIKRIPKS